MNLAIVILAAGKGTRMESDLPKVLHPLLGRALLEHALDAALSLDPSRLIVIVGHGGQSVQECAINAAPRAEIVWQHERLGTGHALAQARPALENFDGHILVTCGDAPLLRAQTLRELFQRASQPGIAAALLVARVENAGSYGRVVLEGPDQSEVARIVEARDASPEELQLRTVNAGTYCFEARALWNALERVGSDNKAGEFYLTDVIQVLRGDGARVLGHDVAPREMTGVNTRAELSELEAQLRAEQSPDSSSEAAR